MNLTVKEAADALGISPARVRKLLESKILVGEKFGPIWSIPQSEIQKRLESNPRAGRPKLP